MEPTSRNLPVQFGAGWLGSHSAMGSPSGPTVASGSGSAVRSPRAESKMFLRRMMAGSRLRWNVAVVVKGVLRAGFAPAGSDASNSEANTRVVPCARKKAHRASVARMIAVENRLSRGVVTEGYYSNPRAESHARKH